MKLNLSLPLIPEEQKSPLVLQLLDFLEHQTFIIQQQGEQIQQLKDEIARLKNQSPKPQIRPSTLETPKKKKRSKSSKGQRPGSQKRHKTAQVEIHQIEPIEPELIPDGAVFRYYKDFVVQDLKLEPNNTLFRCKVYQTPGGQYVSGQLPASLKGKHFGTTLQCYILNQYHHCHVTQPLLREQLLELGLEISAGQLNNLIVENKEAFHAEKEEILAAGLAVSPYLNVDDTGARHQGQNGYCTHIGNEFFSWFESTASKSRINFLQLLRAGRSDYWLNREALAYMAAHQLPQEALTVLRTQENTVLIDEAHWLRFLNDSGIVQPRQVQIATEGALLGSILEQGLSQRLVIVSDDAGQFNVLLHALCWIHAERTINKVSPLTDQGRMDLEEVKTLFWRFYQDLKQYKKNPRAHQKKALANRFDQLFTTPTASASLNAALKRLYRNKAELLLVLDRPEIPLHNNTAEQAIRDYVKKRKISGSTRSESGRKCRDTFATLKKTSRKLGVSFWRYLNDRIKNLGQISPLPDLLRQKVLNPG